MHRWRGPERVRDLAGLGGPAARRDAHSVLTVARRNLAKAPLVDPAGPVTGTGGTTPSGGGLHDDHDHEADAE